MADVEPQAARRRKLIAAARAAPTLKTRLGGPLPAAFWLTDPVRTPHPTRVAAALPAGWGIVYRHFGAGDREETARDLVSIAHRRGLMLLIAADPDLCRKVGAHGVHWPEQRLRGPVRRNRPHEIATASAHSRAAAARAAALGVDAIFASTVFPSRSPSAGPAMGVQRYRRLSAELPTPLFALGGIDGDNAAAIARHSGWASIEAVTESFGGSRLEGER